MNLKEGPVQLKKSVRDQGPRRGSRTLLGSRSSASTLACALLKKGEKGYPRSVLSRFVRKVGADKLESIIEDKVVALLKRSRASYVDAVLDASFVKAWSTRHPKDSQTRFSDGDARVGRAGRTFGLGYKLHLSIDSESRLPLANVVAPANENEKSARRRKLLARAKIGGGR